MGKCRTCLWWYGDGELFKECKGPPVYYSDPQSVTKLHSRPITDVLYLGNGAEIRASGFVTGKDFGCVHYAEDNAEV